MLAVYIIFAILLTVLVISHLACWGCALHANGQAEMARRLIDMQQEQINQLRRDLHAIKEAR